MNLQASLEKLYSLHTFGVKLGLENVQSFLERIGNPQKQLKSFHIAGSNGKGSTAAFIASILQEMKNKVGLYTSPHFVRFNERVKINGKEIPDEYVAGFIHKYENYIDETRLTFFEVTTALAFQYFAEMKVDYAVIETGLGGRLDATNVLHPLSVIITSISFEHTEILGSTLDKIAGEKAGIIRTKTKIFTGKLPEEAVKVINKKADETGSEIFSITDYVIETPSSLQLYTEEIELDDWTMPLRGDYQKYNAALAGLAVSKTLDESDPNIICRGINNVIKNTGFQGRYEFINKKPDIILDSAHNTDGVVNFLAEFNRNSLNYTKKNLLFAVLKDKAVNEMLKLLSASFDEIFITSVNNERAVDTTHLSNIANELGLKANIINDPVSLINNIKQGDREQCLVVLGSMYLIGEIKSALQS